MSSLPVRVMTALFGSWANSGGRKIRSTGLGDDDSATDDPKVIVNVNFSDDQSFERK